MARAATPAIAALRAAGIPHTVVQFKHDPRSASFGEEAVDELARAGDVDPEQVFKTLVIALPKGLGVAVLSPRKRGSPGARQAVTQGGGHRAGCAQGHDCRARRR